MKTFQLLLTYLAMSDASPITPLIRRKVKTLLQTKARSLLGSSNYTTPSDDATLLSIVRELQRQLDALGFSWDNDTLHPAMRQKRWAVIFRLWPTPPIDLLHACRPHNLQVVPNKGSSFLIASRKTAAGLHPGQPAFWVACATQIWFCCCCPTRVARWGTLCPLHNVVECTTAQCVSGTKHEKGRSF